MMTISPDTGAAESAPPDTGAAGSVQEALSAKGAPSAALFTEQLAEHVLGLRREDPTLPVAIIVDTAAEALELKETLARSHRRELHVGVTVESVDQAAARLTALPPGSARLADPADVLECVRELTASGYFAPINGRPGVAEELAMALQFWDRGDAGVRAGLGGDGEPKADRDRARAIRELHDSVARRLAEKGMITIGEVLRSGIDPSWAAASAWVDATVAPPDAAQRQWLARFHRETLPHRLDPSRRGEGVPAGRIAGLTSTVDPLSEAEAAARTVALELENGVAARDIVVAVPDGSRRYSEAVGRALTTATIPCDFAGAEVADDRTAGQSAHVDPLRYTPTGRGISALVAAADEAHEPRLLRFDHLRRICEVAVVADSAGEPITTGRLKQLWRGVRGSDPASWSDPSAFRPDPAAEALAAIGSAVQILGGAREEPAEWALLAEAVAKFLAVMRPVGEADTVCRKSVADLIEAWRNREGATRWSQAGDELAAALQQDLVGRSGGVRIVPLSAAWSLQPQVAVVVGLSDDIIPGTTSPVGPLAPDELLRLAAPSVDEREEWSRKSLRSLQALAHNCGTVHLLFPRSDLLRTIERMPSRHLANLGVPSPDNALGSVSALADLVDSGEAGLLGPADAAAALIRCGADPATEEITRLIPEGVADKVECGDARLRPGRDGAGEGPVDRFNGDLAAFAASAPETLSPDYRKDDEPQLSPSQAERLLGCPIGWWATRRWGMDDPSEWDAYGMDALQFGSWLHEAFALLEERKRLLSPELSADEAEAALWHAVGGDPSAQRRTAEAEEETDLWGFRFRLSGDEITRGARQVVDAARRLRAFLDARGGSRAAVAELNLGPLPLPLASGDLALGGRADRVDDVPDGFVITDFKTGARGEGFQLAAYAWLFAADHVGTATLLYASTNKGEYRAEELDSDDTTAFPRQQLLDWLVGQLEAPVATIRAGALPSRASRDDHYRYCPVCSDLVASRGFGALRSDRAVALAGWEPAAESDDGHGSPTTDSSGRDAGGPDISESNGGNR